MTDDVLKSWQEIARMYSSTFPLPIAGPLYRLARRGPRSDGLSQWKLLVDLFEMTTRTLASASLGWYIYDGCADQEANKEILLRLSKKTSLGDWWFLLRRVVNAQGFAANAFVLGIRELLVSSRGKPSGLARELECIITDRNRKLAHGTTLKDSEYRKLVATHTLPLIRLLTGLDQIGGMKMYAVTDINVDAIEGVLLMGARPEFFPERIDNKLQLSAASVEIGDVVIHLDYDGTNWQTFPMHFYEEDVLEEEIDLMLLDSCITSQSGEFRHISYLAFPSQQYRKFARGDTLAERIFPVLARLASAKTPEMAPSDGEQPDEDFDFDYEIHGQRELVIQHRRRFVGRKEILAEILGAKGGESILVTSVPGQGKTGLAAEVSGRTMGIHHFFSRPAGRGNVSAAVRSLCTQLLRRAGLPLKRLDDPSDLSRFFHNLLFDVARKLGAAGNRLFVILDALDEAETSDSGCVFDFFPSPLPSSVVLVMTSREGDHLLRLGDVGGIRRVRIQPLTPKEIEEAAALTGRVLDKGVVSELFRLSRGNPLFFRLLLDSIGDEIDPLNELDPLSSIGDFYERLLAQFIENETVRTLLAVLHVAGCGLDLQEIGLITELRRPELRAALKSCRSLLDRINSRYSLFHATLHDFLGSNSVYALDPMDIKEAHLKLLKACQESLLGPAYREAHLPGHLLALGHEEAFLESARDPALRFGVASALTAALLGKASGSDHVAADHLLQRLADVDDPNALASFIETAHHLMGMGQYKIFRKTAEAAIDHAIGEGLGGLHGVLARADRESGRLDTCRARLEPILKEGEDECWTPVVRRRLHLILAEALREGGRFDDAELFYLSAQGFFDQQADPDTWLEVVHHLADLRMVRGQFNDALAQLEDGFRIATSAQLPLRSGQILRIIGHVHYIRGEKGSCLEAYEAAHHEFVIADDLCHQGKIATNLAEAHLMDYLDDLSKNPLKPMDGKLSARVHTLLDRAEFVNDSLGQYLELGKTWRARSLAWRTAGNLERSHEALDRAVEILGDVGYSPGIATCSLARAFLLLQEGGDPIEIAAYARDAEARFRRDDRSYPAYRALAVVALAEAKTPAKELEPLVVALNHLNEVPTVKARLESALAGAGLSLDAIVSAASSMKS